MPPKANPRAKNLSAKTQREAEQVVKKIAAETGSPVHLEIGGGGASPRRASRSPSPTARARSRSASPSGRARSPTRRSTSPKKKSGGGRAGKKATDGAGEPRRRKGKPSFKSYLGRIAKSRSAALSGTAADGLNGMCTYLLTEVAAQAAMLARENRKGTITANGVATALKLRLGNLAIVKFAIDKADAPWVKWLALEEERADRRAEGKKKKGDAKRSPERLEDRLGLAFPVGRIHTFMKWFSRRVSMGAAVLTASFLQTLLSEIINQAGESAKAHGRERITPEAIREAIEMDRQLQAALGCHWFVLGQKPTPMVLPQQANRTTRKTAQRMEQEMRTGVFGIPKKRGTSGSRSSTKRKTKSGKSVVVDMVV